MRERQARLTRNCLFWAAVFWLFVIVPASVMSAPYAAVVMDARSGKILHSRNADTRLHPASLTKMMTLYVVFEAIRYGEITEDTLVKVSRKAANEQPSKIGLKAGQKIKLRYLIRAAAVKSANDAATALAEAIEGSEAAFARRMTHTAKRLGMRGTIFKNAHGLTESGHLSTARDMTILGRHLLYDYNGYYHLFSRRSTIVSHRKFSNTNRRLLAKYRGADGIKTGYTRAAGFNLVASAERGSKRIIATVFGGRSTASRNARVAELLDMGFQRAPNDIVLNKPTPPTYRKSSNPIGQARIIRRKITAVKTSLRPQLRPFNIPGGPKEAIQETLIAANATPEVAKSELIMQYGGNNQLVASLYNSGTQSTQTPVNLYNNSALQAAVAESMEQEDPVVLEVVTRISTSGRQHWGVNVGRYKSRSAAEAALLHTAFSELGTLEGSLRKVVAQKTGYDANFYGMTRDTAALACRRLIARGQSCSTIGPD